MEELSDKCCFCYGCLHVRSIRNRNDDAKNFNLILSKIKNHNNLNSFDWRMKHSKPHMRILLKAVRPTISGKIGMGESLLVCKKIKFDNIYISNFIYKYLTQNISN